GAAEAGGPSGRRPRRLTGAPTAPPPPRCAIGPRACAARLSPARREQAGDGLSSLHVPRRDEGARRRGPCLRRLEPAPAAGVGRSGGLGRGAPARGTRAVSAPPGVGRGGGG